MYLRTKIICPDPTCCVVFLGSSAVLGADLRDNQRNLLSPVEGALRHGPDSCFVSPSQVEAAVMYRRLPGMKVLKFDLDVKKVGAFDLIRWPRTRPRCVMKAGGFDLDCHPIFSNPEYLTKCETNACPH